MKSHLAALAALIGLAITGTVQAQKDKPFDFTLPESPRKPAPEWFKIIDQGDKDARLKGYTTPEGIKLEIVAEQPDVVNPVGMTFGRRWHAFTSSNGCPATSNWNEVTETFTYKDGTKRTGRHHEEAVKDVVKTLALQQGERRLRRAQVILEDELPSSILIHDGWLYLSGRGTVRRYRRVEAGRALRREGGHRPGLLRLPPPPGLRPDHRQRRLALHHFRRRRQLRRRLRRQPGDRAAHRRRLPLPAGRLEDAGLRRIGYPQSVSRRGLRRRLQHVPRRQRQRRRQQVHRLPADARRPRGATSAGGCCQGPLLPARPLPRRGLGRAARQGAADAQDRPRRPAGPADLQRDPLPRAIPRRCSTTPTSSASWSGPTRSRPWARPSR